MEKSINAAWNETNRITNEYSDSCMDFDLVCKKGIFFSFSSFSFQFMLFQCIIEFFLD